MANVPSLDEFPIEAVVGQLAGAEVGRGGAPGYPRLIPFFGSGASASAKGVRSPPDLDNTTPIQAFPKARELAIMLAKLANPKAKEFSEAFDLQKSAQYVEVNLQRTDLRAKLQKVFRSSDPRPQSALHDAVVSLSPNIFFTTNYDTLVEDALKRRGADYVVVVEVIDGCGRDGYKSLTSGVPKLSPKDLLFFDCRAGGVDIEPRVLGRDSFNPDDFLAKNCSIVYKMHGSVCTNAELSQFLISDSDYVNFMLSRGNAMLPRMIGKYASIRGFLFLGYSLRDWNFRLLFAKLADQETVKGRERRKIKSYAVMLNSSQMDQDIWKHCSVNIYSGELEAFGTLLANEAEAQLRSGYRAWHDTNA